MTEYAHAHPMSEGRRFEHVHEPPAGTQHAAELLADAHPDMAEAEAAPAPGSPADLRRQAAEYLRQADHYQERAERYVRRAHELEAQADRDEREPPDAGELLRRILDRGET
jgi:hypothetical protein